MFELDARLAGDTHAMGDLPLSRLLLMNDARYPWFILVPRREEISEVFQLDAHTVTLAYQQSHGGFDGLGYYYGVDGGGTIWLAEPYYMMLSGY